MTKKIFATRREPACNQSWFLHITLLVVGKGEVGAFFFWHSTCQVGQHCILRVIKETLQVPRDGKASDVPSPHVHWQLRLIIGRFFLMLTERQMLCLLDGIHKLDYRCVRWLQKMVLP
jgi:hypothetical protein